MNTNVVWIWKLVCYFSSSFFLCFKIWYERHDKLLQNSVVTQEAHQQTKMKLEMKDDWSNTAH